MVSNMNIVHELGLVKQSDIYKGFLYIWIPNRDDPKVVKLSDCGEYILSTGDFDAEAWDFSLSLSGFFYGPIVISGVDTDDLILDDE